MTVIADNARRAKLGSNNVLVRARKQNDKMSVLIFQLKTPSLYLWFYRFIEHLLNDLVEKEHILCVWFLFALLIVLPLFFPIDAENQNQNSHQNFHPKSDLES